MRLLSLNTAGGRLYDELIRYIRDVHPRIDILCLQEMYDTTEPEVRNSGDIRANLFGEISKVLPDFFGFFAPAQDGYDGIGPVRFSLSYGLAIFIRNHITVQRSGDFFLYGTRNSMVKNDYSTMPRNFQWVQCAVGAREYVIGNVHTHRSHDIASDHENRMEQAYRIQKFLRDAPHEKIVCGDLNLFEDTKSMHVLENGMRNMIAEHHIEELPGVGRFSDDILVSRGIEVRHFEISQRTISDHVPLMLEWD